MTAISHIDKKNRPNDYPYFRRTWKKVVMALLVSSFVPLILIGGGLYYYFACELKQKTLDSLKTEVIQHNKSIDRFLSERIVALKLISEQQTLAELALPGRIQSVFQSLHRQFPCFEDIGIIDAQGKHNAYVGPYSLLTANYKNAPWFKSVMAREIFVSDIFMGFRNVPHFIVAVKQNSDGSEWIIRVTINVNIFDNMVSEITGDRKGDTYLINTNGLFQTRPKIGGELMAQSQLSAIEPFDGIRTIENGKSIILTTWQKQVPWICVVQMERKELFKTLHQTRNIAILVFLMGGFLMVLTILLTTNYLVSRLESKKRIILILDKQLRHISYISSAMELSNSFFQEINDTLANIDITATWLQDLTEPEKTKEIKDGMAQIKSQVAQSRKAMDRFLQFIRPGESIITDIDINKVLDNLTEILGKELHLRNIRIKKEFQPSLPVIRSDRTKIRQVFQNIVLNAISAIGSDGEITLVTQYGENEITISITDNGPGIEADSLKSIFEPLYTTKPEGTGLGLPICLDILEKLGGTIRADSGPEKGTFFIIALPLEFEKPAIHKNGAIS
ncbi:MAG: hypothetical protein K9L30_03670 [Desulfobacterales bacterium]|nr:hypothetical protein [Desulfobacterales bacterium]